MPPDLKVVTWSFAVIPAILFLLFIIGTIVFGIYVAIWFVIGLFRGEFGGVDHHDEHLGGGCG